ncbi:amino acid transporter [Mycolicibacterium chubuense]|uniref:Putrescine importer PuuP n=1 Tax=Mycolicibacterium chubuense TaxID=1800 RepID=A0A0J6W759_MYCCU|nr:APC family permease [Mycolicibacterium chubuense]KMO77673.1 Putrescine importer PuuP [Mycolicibacterium chubuense]ORA54273.1 amino acid transporter [Mycolicibacterium chubuense]SPX96756.1 amino acid transporter [Mycolicibacterium chubuense]
MANRIDETGGANVADDAADPHAHRRLRGTLGVWGIVFVVVAAASPLGVIGGPVPLGIASGNGVGFPAIFIISTVIVLLFAVGFTALTPHVPNAGAFYSYIGKGLGRITGFGFAFVALISYLALEIGVYGLIGQGAQALFSSYGLPDIHWGIWALATLVIVTVLGHRNIDLSRNVLGVLLIAEVAIVLVLDAVVAVTGGHEGLSAGFLSPSEIVSGAPGIALLFAFLSFIGFEATAVFRDEARDPLRTIPRATFLALLLIGAFYTVSTWALITAWGDSRVVEQAVADPSGLLPGATQEYLGTVGLHIVQVLFVTSLFACILSFHNVVARYVFTLSNRKVFPASLGEAHVHHASPHLASGLDGIVVLVFLVAGIALGLDPVTQFYTWLAGISTVGIIILLIATSVAVLAFFARRRRSGDLDVSVWRAFVAPGIGLVGLVAVLLLVFQNLPVLVGGSTPIAIGVVVLLVAVFAAGAAIAARRPQVTLE